MTSRQKIIEYVQREYRLSMAIINAYAARIDTLDALVEQLNDALANAGAWLRVEASVVPQTHYDISDPRSLSTYINISHHHAEAREAIQAADLVIAANDQRVSHYRNDEIVDISLQGIDAHITIRMVNEPSALLAKAA